LSNLAYIKDLSLLNDLNFIRELRPFDVKSSTPWEVCMHFILKVPELETPRLICG
jgi:hypothetical protein